MLVVNIDNLAMNLILDIFVKSGKILIFLKNSKTVISVGNWKFYRSQMTKRTSSLNSSCEI